MFLALTFTTLITSLQIEDLIYLFFDDVDGRIEKNNGIKYLLFTLTEKNKEALKSYKKLWEKTKRQIEVINDDESIEYRKNLLLHLFLKKMVNIIHNFFYMNARVSYKNVIVRKK